MMSRASRWAWCWQRRSGRERRGGRLACRACACWGRWSAGVRSWRWVARSRGDWCCLWWYGLKKISQSTPSSWSTPSNSLQKSRISKIQKMAGNPKELTFSADIVVGDINVLRVVRGSDQRAEVRVRQREVRHHHCCLHSDLDYLTQVFNKLVWRFPSQELWLEIYWSF